MSSLFFYYATMNAGKSSQLLQNNYNYIERGMKTLVLKPAVDTREGEAVVRSRIGNETPCTLFGLEEDVYQLVSQLPRVHCIFIDEAQFMTSEQIDQLAALVDVLEIPVMCYGLRSDFQGNLFPGSSALFAKADKLFEVRTICWCGSLANMVLRLGPDGEVVREGEQVVVGGNDKYISVCRKHFVQGLIKHPIQL